MGDDAKGGRYHHGDLPAALLDAVDRLVTRDGVAGLSLRKVAREAGVSHTAAAHHFDGWGGLLSAYTARGFVAFRDALDTASDALGTDASPEARMHAAGSAYVDFALDSPGRYEVMFRDDLHGDVTDPHHEEAGQAAFQVVIDRVSACLEDPDPDVVLRLAVTAWSTVHGLAHLLIDGPLKTVTDEDTALGMRDGVMATLMAAMRAEDGWRRDPDLTIA